MNQPAFEVPPDGLPIDARHLFLVDVDHKVDDVEIPTRRAFVDLERAVAFIGNRASRLSVFASPIGPSTDAVLFGSVEEAFASKHSKTYMLRFSNAPSFVIKCSGASADSEFEPYYRIYPPQGAPA
ncbi:hypothetical protein G8A07_06900 [Roseateles sp. DAIF2]|uniref:hypothetical protein n=1 Tax=Roseateles sp. DAIF2 TaxID=2714952 RepID=UPI0018A2F693|nr:hypothetical protein [Roseateles sp. DAIF2]QPF72681.1 hypothetical protein G8A07_06900 [Roseateles sp. DAIF2]